MSAEDQNPSTKYWLVIMDALGYKARGEQMPDDVADSVEEAAVILAATTLVRAGMSMETAERKFTEEDYTIKLTYEYDTEELGLTIDWGDGDEMRWTPADGFASAPVQQSGRNGTG